MSGFDFLISTLLVKPALLVAAAAAIAHLLRTQSAAARHAIWAGAMVGALLLPALELAVPPLRVPLAGAVHIPALTVASRKDVTPGTPATLRDSRIEPAGVPSGGASREGRGGAGLLSHLPTILVGIWLLGIALFGGRRIRAEVGARGIVRRARTLPSGRARDLCAKLIASEGGAHVELRVSDEIASPATCGVIRPVILLPAGAERWSADDLTSAVVHELSHVSRRDCLVTTIAELAVIAYWCNPLVRFGLGRVRRESESACDDRVLRRGAEPERYAELLLAVASRSRRTGLVTPATAMARPSELESRLLAVLDERVPRAALPRWGPLVLGSIGVVLAPFAAALSLGAAPPRAVQITAPEPDRRGDSLASPESERVPAELDLAVAGRRARVLLAGPDSLLAQRLVLGLGREPQHEGDLVQARAAWALMQARDGRLLDPLVQALDADDWRERAYAAWALAGVRDDRVTGRLVPLLRHQVWRMRAMAAHALASGADRSAIQAMTTALTDPAWQVRVEAVEYFAALEDDSFTQSIRQRLEDRHIAVRLAAERALAAR